MHMPASFIMVDTGTECCSIQVAIPSMYEDVAALICSLSVKRRPGNQEPSHRLKQPHIGSGDPSLS